MGVTKLFKSINPKKAQGPDEIPCRILNELDNELTPALAAIFNQSLKTGELPLAWNEAIVTPIYKKGYRDPPANYRPISMTCVCCKSIEHIICTHIIHHLDTHNILSKLQHGFRSRHTCVSQLTITINDLLTHRDKRTQIDMRSELTSLRFPILQIFCSNRDVTRIFRYRPPDDPPFDICSR